MDKSPSSLKDDDYKSFHRELYPMNFEAIVSHSLNVDYPFNLTGILIFPKVETKCRYEQRIQLYCNQVAFDSVEGIVLNF